MERARAIIHSGSVPRLPRGTRFRFDQTRQNWVILAPERVLMPDEIAVEVLKLVDGARSVAAIADDLASRFGAARNEIEADVIAMLQDLADKALLDDATGAGTVE